ncbi:hypothetical protein [Actinomadura oligospora]|uniref:hypothetical protein n=1 Tax=Actinomadura oligospora TaxID=111804 RepID=UPI0004BCE877|nr:hypothetical protein [Actinomadura oligospora]
MAVLLTLGGLLGGIDQAHAVAVEQPTRVAGCGGTSAGNGWDAAEGDFLTADEFISCYRKASIRRVFPSQFLSWTIGDIRSDKSAAGKRAWKLLNDNRFKK